MSCSPASDAKWIGRGRISRARLNLGLLQFGDLYALRTEALGLDDRPQVTVEMAIPVSRFHQFKQITAAQSENGDYLLSRSQDCAAFAF